MAILPQGLQGYTNGIHVFDKVICKVLAQLITQGRCKPFIDDVVVKPVSRSSDRIGIAQDMRKRYQAFGGM